MGEPASDLPPRRAATTSVRDAMAEAARRRPAPPTARRLLWIALFATVLLIALAQVLGWTKSPIAERIVQDRERRGETQPSTVPAPPARGPEAPGR